MTDLIRIYLFLFLIIICLLPGNQRLIASTELDIIREAIIRKDIRWIATKNPVTELQIGERQSLYGMKKNDPMVHNIKVRTLNNRLSLPAKFDWRDNNGDWITTIKNQSIPRGCGSCWAFSAIAQVESWWKIFTQNAAASPDLSEQYLLSHDGDCEGGFITTALEIVKMYGIPFEDCMPYQADSDIPLSDMCDDWMDHKIRIPGWFYVTGAEPTVAEIKNAVIRHPVSTGMDVYGDFEYYTGGVYEPVIDKIVGYHAVLIIGWDDDQESWICKNSWGASWGENGFFRIKYNKCAIGKFMPFIWDENNIIPPISVLPSEINTDILNGDSITQNITISNQMATNLLFNIVGFENNPCFHTTNFLSFQGKSWWSGDAYQGGYENNSIQFLDTPILNFAQHDNVRMTCKLQWLLEHEFEKDGCNVWISQDGGKSFSQIFPDFPLYNGKFISGFWLKSTGRGIKGWTGSSNGWVNAQFDLSCFRSDSTVIRFAFASDDEICTQENQELRGFFIDNIRITADENIVFENYGESEFGLNATGFSISDEDWFQLSQEKGTVSPFSDIIIDFNLNSGNMKAGIYRKALGIMLSDMIYPFLSLNYSFKLEPPDYDLAIDYLWPDNNTIKLFTQNNNKPSILIQNEGILPTNAIKVKQSVQYNHNIIHVDTIEIPELSPGDSIRLITKPYNSTIVGLHNFKLELIDFYQDYNSFNNNLSTTLFVSNIIDDFESENELWQFNGGWGKTSLLVHEGKYAIHIDPYNYNYQPNMDATMQYNYPLILPNECKASISYWTNFHTEGNTDYCQFEISTDQEEWSIIDSFSGTNLNWDQRLVTLPQSEDSLIWLRFHFVSDKAVEYFGVAIDDIKIHYNQLSENISRIEPNNFELNQNYPNPFNQSTVISWQVGATNGSSRPVEISIYNILGQKIETLLNKPMPAGYHEIEFNGQNLSSGVYLYRITVGERSNVKKMLLVK